MNKSISNATASRGVLAPGARLAIAAATIAAIWLIVLPRIAALPPVQSHIQRNEAAGIDPSAKFYSELPAMPRLLDRVRRARFCQPDRPAVREAAPNAPFSPLGARPKIGYFTRLDFSSFRSQF